MSTTNPTGDRVLSTYDNGQPATWEEAGTGKPYTIDTNPHSSHYGQKTYLSPRAVNPYDNSPNANGPYKSGLLGGGSQWNSQTGQWDKKSNTLEKITLGAALVPFGAAAFGGFGGGGSAGMPALSEPASVLPSASGGILADSGAAGLPWYTAAGVGDAIPGAGMSSMDLAGGGLLSAAGKKAADVAKKKITGSGNSLTDDLINLGLDGAGGLLSGLGESLFQQKRQSFKGTANDPGTLLSKAGSDIDAYKNKVNSQTLPDLSNLTVQGLPTFTGGGLPSPIGVTGGQPGVTRRTSAPMASLGDGGFDQLRAALDLLNQPVQRRA